MSQSKGFAPPPADFTCGIAVMAKASAAGRTKTRLVPPLTGAEAAEANTAFLKDIFANITEAARRAPITGHAAYGPPGTGAFFADILPDIDRFEAWRPSFGDCLRLALEHLFARGHRGAAVLNADSPTLPPALLVEMAEALMLPGDRGVLGPSTDGGYYLLALKTPHDRLFEDIAWSTDQVAAQTLARAREISLPMHILPAWYDVDDAAALRTLDGELLGGVPFDGGALTRGAARHSTDFLARLLETADLAARLHLPEPCLSAPHRPAPLRPGPDLRRAS